MTKVLITGATGNVGIAVLDRLAAVNHSLKIYAGVRNLATEKVILSKYDAELVKFDFMDETTFLPGLQNCDILFLLRPPQISDVAKYFKPLIDNCLKAEVKHIVFLSVQGVESSSIIPHHKIEKLIVESKIPYTFLRPAYFMQNFTTTLRQGLIGKREIFLPAGNAKFTLIDAKDIGDFTAQVLSNIENHQNKAYDLTNNQKLTFGEMAKLLSTGLGVEIKYRSPNLVQFFIAKRKEKVPAMFILVMIMLHYLPRFQKEPAISNWVEEITKRQPIGFEEFVMANREKLLG